MLMSHVTAHGQREAIYDVVVIDTEGAECGHHENMSKESEKWWEGHRDNCDVNYHGSSPAMEATGALRIWQRSVEKHNLRYTVVISDGDSKTIKHLNDNRPYGEIEIMC